MYSIQGNSILDKLDMMLILARGFAAKEVPRGVSTINFKTLILRDKAAGLILSHVVKYSAYGMSL